MMETPPAEVLNEVLRSRGDEARDAKHFGTTGYDDYLEALAQNGERSANVPATPDHLTAPLPRPKGQN